MVIDPSLAVQEMIVARLQDIPAQHGIPWPLAVFDKGDKPEVFPCVIVGEATSIYPDYVNSFHIQTRADLHVWTREPNLASVKLIAGASRKALLRGPWAVSGHRCTNAHIEQARYMRDGTEYSHGVLTLLALLQEDEQPQ